MILSIGEGRILSSNCHQTSSLTPTTTWNWDNKVLPSAVSKDDSTAKVDQDTQCPCASIFVSLLMVIFVF